MAQPILAELLTAFIGGECPIHTKKDAGHITVHELPVNIVETKDVYVIAVYNAGCEKGDVDVKIIDERTLTIRVVRNLGRIMSLYVPLLDYSIVQRECLAVSERSLKLPNTIDQDTISAVHNNGILVLSFEKLKQSRNSKQVHVN